MKTAIIGLGLIGGSLAKAFKARSENTVYGADLDHDTLTYAKLSETIDEVLTEETLKECKLIIIALYPDATVKWLESNAHLISKEAIVIDTCGTKRAVCKAGFETAKKHGFTFIGGHPMAGTQFSGIKYSRADLFKGASMVIVPEHLDNMALLEEIKELLAPAGFGKITPSTADEHDKIIAFTSQLAHVVSSAYIKSDTANVHHGFSAGSYKDMTRVATLNEQMWATLFLENSENLVHELDSIINALDEYRTAIKNNDREKLVELLHDGCVCKALVDGK